MTFIECDSATSDFIKLGALIDYATDSFSCRDRYVVRAVCNYSYHCQKHTIFWKVEKKSVILCTESRHLILIRFARNAVNMKATEGAVTKPEGYCFLTKQNCKHEIFMACCALYFGLLYLYFWTR